MNKITTAECLVRYITKQHAVIRKNKSIHCQGLSKSGLTHEVIGKQPCFTHEGHRSVRMNELLLNLRTSDLFQISRQYSYVIVIAFEIRTISKQSSLQPVGEPF